MPTNPPLVTLTTDFGTRDAYVAELKGVLLSEGPPDLRVVDLSHELSPFDVHGAALFVRAALPRFPVGSVHLVVVDPGVGSQRRALIVQRNDMTLVGPDNCVFSYLLDGSETLYEIDRDALGERPISSTFHGRDLFAPVAARLAAGMAADTLGRPLESVQRMAFPMVEIRGDALQGRIIHVDRYGNLVTNIGESTLRGFLGARASGSMCLMVGEHAIRKRVDHYAEGKRGELVVLIGSAGFVEIAAREASAASLLAAEVGRNVRVVCKD